MTPIEVISVVGVTAGIIWIMLGIAGEEIDPEILARREAVVAAEESLRRQYTNVVTGKKVRTVKHTTQGTNSGTGTGSAASKKS